MSDGEEFLSCQELKNRDYIIFAKNQLRAYRAYVESNPDADDKNDSVMHAKHILELYRTITTQIKKNRQRTYSGRFFPILGTIITLNGAKMSVTLRRVMMRWSSTRCLTAFWIILGLKSQKAKKLLTKFTTSITIATRTKPESVFIVLRIFRCYMGDHNHYIRCNDHNRMNRLIQKLFISNSSQHWSVHWI